MSKYVTSSRNKVVTKSDEPSYDELKLRIHELEQAILNYKNNENTFCENENRFRIFFDQGLIGMAITTVEKGWVDANDVLCNMLGYSRTELLKLTWIELTHPDDLKAENILFKRLLAGDIDDYSLEKRFIRRDNRIIHASISINAVRKADGHSVDYILALVQDISDQKMTEEKLKANEKNLRSIFENMHDIYYKVDQNGKVIAASPSAIDLYGYNSLDEIIGKHDFDFVYNISDNEKFSEELQEKGSVKNYIIKHKRKNGEPLYVETNTNILLDDDGNPAGATGVFRDITDRLKAEDKQKEHIRFLENLGAVDKAIHKSINLNQMLQNLVKIVIELFDCDRAWLLYPCDPNATHFRVPVEMANPKYPGANILNLNVPMTASMQSDMTFALVVDGPVTFGPGNQKPISSDTHKNFMVQSQMFMSIHPDIDSPWLFGIHQCSDARVWSNYEMQLFKEIGRRVSDGLRSFLFFRDLKESEEKYRSIMNSMEEATYICSSDFRIEYMNPAMLKQIGFDATGETCHKVLSGFDDKCPWCVMEKVLTGQSLTFEIVSPLNDRAYNISNSPIFHSDGSISKLSILRDITEYKKMETNLQQAQKLEAIAVLAGGIAHDFNNILFPIIGLTEMLLEKNQTKKTEIDLKIILKAGKRAKNLISQILTFSRKQKHEMQSLKLQPLLKEVIKLSRATIPSNIKIDMD